MGIEKVMAGSVVHFVLEVWLEEDSSIGGEGVLSYVCRELKNSFLEWRIEDKILIGGRRVSGLVQEREVASPLLVFLRDIHPRNRILLSGRLTLQNDFPKLLITRSTDTQALHHLFHFSSSA